MFCANCGKELEVGAAFCPECGVAVKQPAESVQPAEPVRTAEPIQSAEPVQSEPFLGKPSQQAAASDYSRMPQEQPARKKKGGRAGLIAVIAVLVLVAAAGVAGVLFYLSPEQKYNRAMNRADDLMSEDAYAEAIAAYEEAWDLQESKEAKKSLVKAYIAYADDLNGREEYSDAVEAVEKAFKYDKGNEDAQEELLTAYLGMGRQSMESGAYEEAERLFDKVTALDADNEDAIKGLIGCYAGYGRRAADAEDYTSALSYYRQILEWDETNVDACCKIARLTALQGNALQALEILEERMNYYGEDADLLEEKNYLLEHAVKLSCDTSNVDGSRCYEEYGEEGNLHYSCYYNQYGQVEYECEYNTDGNVVSRKEYGNDGLAGELVSEYDEKGRLSHSVYSSEDYSYETSFRYDDNDNIIWQRSDYANGYYEENSVYDAEGRQLSYESSYSYTDGNTGNDRATNEYNEYGDLVKASYTCDYTDEYGGYHNTTTTMYEYEYDDSGRQIAKLEYQPDGGEDAYLNYYAYDKEGRVTEQDDYIIYANGYGADYTAALAAAIEEGDWSYENHSRMEYYADGTVSWQYNEDTGGWREYYYNELGNMTSSSVYYSYNGVTTYTELEYDDHDREVRRKVQTSSGRNTEYEYTYTYNAFGDMTEYYDSYNGYRTGYRYRYGLVE